jgi:hypothetical protein
MNKLNPEEIKLYKGAENLPEELWQDLEARDPEEAARAAGAEYKGGGFTLCMLGDEFRISLDSRHIANLTRPEAEVDFQSGMVLLCELAGALEVPAAERMVTPQELPGGAMFFTGPHALASPLLEKRYGQRPQDLMAAAKRLGAKPTEGADMAIVLPGLPNLPMYVLFWAADEEFTARAVLGVDANSRHHLALDGIWALTNLLVERLCMTDPLEQKPAG